MKQLLNKNRSRYSSNKVTSINVDLNSSQRLLPYNNVNENINAYQVYLDEKNNCSKFRLIFNIHPYCSNVLHNLFTEIMQNEGGDNCIVLSDTAITTDTYRPEIMPINTETSNLTRLNAIMDTEYSHPAFGKFVYHCGTDIFDNHTFRHKAFYALSGISDTDTISKTIFNTIKDAKRDSQGVISEVPLFGLDSDANSAHTFNVNNFNTFLESYSQNLYNKDGWYGFYNPSSIPFSVGTYNEQPIYINKAMNNNKICEFYEMYPDRSLYSFIPKINKLRGRREEYNWDYCLTFPYKEELNPNGCDFVNNSNYNLNGIKIIETVEDSDKIYFRTILKHNLGDTSTINFKYIYSSEEEPFQISLSVEAIGDINKANKDIWFSVKTEDLDSILEYTTNSDGTATTVWPDEMRISKVIDEVECSYYFRIFKKIPSEKLLLYTPNKNSVIDEDDINQALEGGNISSVIGKAGFARTIYDEQVAEIVFNEDIQTRYLRDNKGRKLSEIYLTILKRARGGEKWYDEHIYNTEDIEFSHCFGKLTAGLDLPLTDEESTSDEVKDAIRDYNIHCIYNYSGRTNNTKPWWDAPDTGKVLADNIKIEDTCFIGDVVEWDYSNCKETTLSECDYRFNTYQREYNGTDFQIFTYHDIIKDDNTVTEKNKVGDFEVSTKTFGNAQALANVFQEGYYYKPHYKITLREFSDDVDTYYDSRVVYYDYSHTGDTYDLYTSLPQVIYSGEYITLRYNDIAYDCEVISMPDSNTIRFMINDDLGDIIDEIDNQLALYVDPDNDVDEDVTVKNNPFDSKDITCFIKGKVPTDAIYVPFSGNEYKKREFKNYENCDSELKDATFTNDAIYLENNINLYLRRQDPFGIYGLRKVADGTGESIFLIEGTKFEYDDTAITVEEGMTSCD